MLAKPSKSKVRKLPPLNDSEYPKCLFCENPFTLEINEIWRGRNRTISIAYGMYVYMCHRCHSIVTLNPDGEMDHKLREYGKKKFAELYPHLEHSEVFK